MRFRDRVRRMHREWPFAPWILYLATGFWVGWLASWALIRAHGEVHPVTHVAFVVGVLVAAWHLYWVRSRSRLLYGWLEIVVGLVLAWRAMVPAPDPTTHVLSFMAAIYVCVRGIDNIMLATGTVPKSSPVSTAMERAKTG